MICSLRYLLFLHPLWLRLIVFLIRIVISLLKFFQLHENGIFSYLFVIVYSGGLLLLLVYISSLVPNRNLTIKYTFYFIVIFRIFICSIYIDENFNFECNLLFSSKRFLGIRYFINYKDLTYSLILILFLSFCLVSLLLSFLKYPIRSL